MQVNLNISNFELKNRKNLPQPLYELWYRARSVGARLLFAQMKCSSFVYRHYKFPCGSHSIYRRTVYQDSWNDAQMDWNSVFGICSNIKLWYNYSIARQLIANNHQPPVSSVNQKNIINSCHSYFIDTFIRLKSTYCI